MSGRRCPRCGNEDTELSEAAFEVEDDNGQPTGLVACLDCGEVFAPEES